MRAALLSLNRAIAPLRRVGRDIARRALETIWAGWRWLDSLDIPLSPLQWLLGFYAVFGVLYLLATPAFEAGDEIWHFGYAQHVRATGELPVQDLERRDTLYRQHGSQPPLYYWAIVALISPISLDDADDLRRLNPHALENKPGAFGNKNRVARDESVEALQGTRLAVALVRAAGLLMGAGTIALVFHIGALISPQRPVVAFVAAAIAGLNPMFIFVSASVNNDSLAMLLNSAVILLTLRMLRDGFASRSSLAIALLFAFACLTKVTSLALIPALAGVALLARRKTKDIRGFIMLLGTLVVCWLVIDGWWIALNWQRYGEPLGIITQANLSGGRGMYFDLADLLAEFQQFRMSHWGLFGAANIQFASFFYALMDLALVLGIGGCVFLILQLLAIRDFAYARYELAHLLALVGTAFVLCAGSLYLATLMPVTQGRMLFPLTGVLAPLLAVGLVETSWWLVFSLRPPNLAFVRAGDAVPKPLLKRAMLWQLRILGLAAFLAPLSVIAVQYNAPETVESPSARARPVFAQYGDVALLAYERTDRRYSAGEDVRIRLYWQVAAQSPSDNSVHLRLVDDLGQTIGSYRTYPGAGKLRTSTWQAGAVYPDEYTIPISQAAYGRYPFDLRVEWTGERGVIPASDESGQQIEPVSLDIGAVVSLRQQTAARVFNEIPADDQPVFDDAIRLEGFQVDIERNEIGLHWKADSAPEVNYTVFAHLLDENGEILSQADSPPRLPTRYWRWGEAFTTFHQFPPGVLHARLSSHCRLVRTRPARLPQSRVCRAC